MFFLYLYPKFVINKDKFAYVGDESSGKQSFVRINPGIENVFFI